MTLEELLKHPRVANLDVRHTDEDGFIIHPFISDKRGFCSPRAPSQHLQLQEVVNKLAKRFDLEL